MTAPGGDNVIDNEVVLIEPELVGWAGLRKRVQAAAKLADTQVQIKANLDDTKLRSQIVGLRLRMMREAQQLTRNFNERVQRDEIRAHNVRFSQTRSFLEQVQRAEVAAYREAAKRETDATKLAEREASKRSRARAAASGGIFKDPGIIDFGGRGIRPMNLLLGTVVALTPAMFAMGASALQASTSIVALGSAGIGAALGLGGLAVAFKSVTDAWTLRKSVQNQAMTEAANASTKAITDASEELRARNQLIDAQKAELQAAKDLHDARKEAVRDLVDMRQKVADLQNQQREDTVSLAEAEAERAKVRRSFFATALDKARADQNVRNARQRLSDTTLDRKEATQDLAEGVKKGVEGSDKVTRAREALRQARERRAEASLSKQANGARNAVEKTTSPMAQLQQKIADMSPAAQEMYHWLDDNEKLFKRLTRTVEQGVLPGFTQFLREVGTTPKHGKSTLDVLAEDAGALGGQLGRVVAAAGKLSTTKWFRSSLAKIQTNNMAGFGMLGDAALISIKPIMQILEKASPLFTQMAKGLKDGAKWFAKWIDEANSSGALADWFDNAAKQGKLWLRIAKNILTVFFDLFKGSLPTGESLVSRFEKFTASIAKWTSSDQGQAKIKSFFEFFKNLDYDKVREFFVNAAAAFVGLKAVKWAAANPFWTALGTLAASNPQLLEGALKAVTAMLTTAASNPGVIAGIAGMLTAFKFAKTVKLGLELPGLDRIKDKLTGRFSKLDKFLGGGASTATMTVRAGVVNVLGGSGVPGATPVPVGPGGKSSTFGKVAATALTVAGGVVAASFAVDTVLDKPGASIDGFKALAGGPESYAQWSRENAPGFRRFFSMTLPGWLTDGGTRGWASFKDAFINTFGAPAAHWFSITLPNALNLGAGGSGGWAGLATNLGHWFSTTLPNALSGGNGDGWSGLGDYTLQKAKEFIGLKLPEGVQNGIDAGRAWLWEHLKTWTTGFWNWLKKLFGIASPSTITAEMGGNLIQGLWDGFVDKWTSIYKTVTTWVQTNITAPLVTIFGDIGGAVRDAFISPFDTLTSKLAGPVQRAFDWVNSHLIDPLNLLLTTVGLPKIELIKPGGIGGAAGDAIGKVAPILKRRDGGLIFGNSAHSRADDINARLTANEFVQPVDAVHHYGVGFMEAVRTKRFPKFADGGLIEGLRAAQGSNLATDLITGALKGVSLQGLLASMTSALFGPIGGGKAVGDPAVAETAEATARAMGATEKQLVALISAGIVESGMRNLTRAVDHDSLGFLQQRPSQGWGTPAQITNVAYATRKFIEVARSMDGPGISAGELAARVQRPRADLRGKYGEREGDAVATINRLAPYLSSYGGGGGGGGGGNGAGLVAFGRWLQERGYTVSEHPAFGGVHGGHVNNSKHYQGRAIDVNHGAGTSAAEQAWLSKIIPEAHRRGFHTIFMAPHHYDHAHIDFNRGGLVPRKYDTGGVLPPGYTLAFNGTGRNETVRTSRQESALSGPMRLDRRDIAALATHIAGATSPTVHMDGRKVAEITNAYTYLPAGV